VEPGQGRGEPRKHGISFEEASTVSADPLSVTIPDSKHSGSEVRFLLLGRSAAGRLLVVAHTERGERIASSARGRPRAVNGGIMNREAHEDDNWEMLEEYDFSGGVRGKYAERYARGTNLVLLDPDVAEVFPNAEAVNEALRALAGVIRAREARTQAA
jgi:uncharacterized DUF497 family protein